jgi:hypothetical protein
VLSDDGVPTLLSEADSTDNMWILGTAFLEQIVTVLDFESGRVGFATPTSTRSGFIEQMTDSPVILKVEMLGGGSMPGIQSQASPLDPPVQSSFPTALPSHAPSTENPFQQSSAPIYQPLTPQQLPLEPPQPQYSSDPSMGMYSAPAPWNTRAHPPDVITHENVEYYGGYNSQPVPQSEDLDEAAQDRSNLRVFSAVLLWIAWGVGVAVAVVLLWSWQSYREVEILPTSQTERLARQNSQLDEEEDDAAE